MNCYFSYLLSWLDDLFNYDASVICTNRIRIQKKKWHDIPRYKESILNGKLKQFLFLNGIIKLISQQDGNLHFYVFFKLRRLTNEIVLVTGPVDNAFVRSSD